MLAELLRLKRTSFGIIAEILDRALPANASYLIDGAYITMKIINRTLFIATLAFSASAFIAHAEGGHGDANNHSVAELPTLGDAVAGEQAVAVCTACHGSQGQSTMADNPVLAGQSERFIYEQLVAFQSGDRANAIMASQVTNLTDDDFKNIATYFSQQSPVYSEAPADADLELGQHIYQNGIADRGVPSCIGCHGIEGSGIAASGYPALAGQHSQYIATRLNAYAGETSERANAKIMQGIAIRLRADEIEALSAYVQGLQPRNSDGS